MKSIKNIVMWNLQNQMATQSLASGVQSQSIPSGSGVPALNLQPVQDPKSTLLATNQSRRIRV